MSATNHVDPETGSIEFNGRGVITKGDHSHMPARTDAYLDGDERGHIQASSQGGSNDKDNVVPMQKDVNRGSYRAMERAETAAMKSGAVVDSNKIAYADAPGARPSAFMVNDTITYPDGHTAEVHLSFSNISNEEQEQFNAEAAAIDFDDGSPNPGDELRESMSEEEYAELMEETDAELPSIADYYAPDAYSYTPSYEELPGEDVSAGLSESSPGESSSSPAASEDAGASASTGTSADNGSSADAGASVSASSGTDGGVGGDDGGESADGGMDM